MQTPVPPASSLPPAPPLTFKHTVNVVDTSIEALTPAPRVEMDGTLGCGASARVVTCRSCRQSLVGPAAGAPRRPRAAAAGPAARGLLAGPAGFALGEAPRGPCAGALQLSGPARAYLRTRRTRGGTARRGEGKERRGICLLGLCCQQCPAVTSSMGGRGDRAASPLSAPRAGRPNARAAAASRHHPCGPCPSPPAPALCCVLLSARGEAARATAENWPLKPPKTHATLVPEPSWSAPRGGPFL
jgi:hypothetical protein